MVCVGGGIILNLFIIASMLNSFLASVKFFRQLMTSANSLDQDQDRHSVGPDLDPNCLTLW